MQYEDKAGGITLTAITDIGVLLICVERFVSCRFIRHVNTLACYYCKESHSAWCFISCSQHSEFLKRMFYLMQPHLGLMNEVVMNFKPPGGR